MYINSAIFKLHKLLHLFRDIYLCLLSFECNEFLWEVSGADNICVMPDLESHLWKVNRHMAEYKKIQINLYKYLNLRKLT
jgi:hypothetical protein